MAIITVVAAVNVILVLAGGRDAIVAGSAGTGYLRVINCICRHPDIRCMAVLADIACLDMRLVFARGFDAVVATSAVVRNAYVIKVCR